MLNKPLESKQCSIPVEVNIKVEEGCVMLEKKLLITVCVPM